MYKKFTAMKDKRIQGIMVSEMVNGGTEMMIGANRDPTFGPIVVCSFNEFVDVLGWWYWWYPRRSSQGCFFQHVSCYC